MQDVSAGGTDFRSRIDQLGVGISSQRSISIPILIEPGLFTKTMRTCSQLGQRTTVPGPL
jgi:hypothetical protein